MLLHTDSRRRITIPAEAGIKPGDTIEVDILPDGRILLVPMASIPRHQLWAWTPENRQKITDSITDPRPSTVVEDAKDLESIAKRYNGEN